MKCWRGADRRRRVMISEKFEINSTAGPWTPDKISHIVRVLGGNFDHTTDEASLELYPDKEMDRSTHHQESRGADLVESLARLEPFHQPGRPLEHDVPRGHGGDRTQGRIDETLMGHDCGGIVTCLGPGTEQSELRAGDRAYDLMPCHRAITGAVRLVEESATTGVRPVFPRTVFPMSDMESAMRQMQGAAHMGRVILSPRPRDQVIKVVARPRPLDFGREESTYPIAGGLGGLGRVIALWVVGKRAKNIALVSRNAEAHHEAASLAQKASEGCCRLHIRDCDVADEESVAKLLAECSAALPPIRGVVIGSMVLDDSVFEHMTYDQWLRATRPKLLEAVISDSPRRKADKSQVIVCLARYGVIEEGPVSKRDRRFATVRFGGAKSSSAADDDETKPSAAPNLTRVPARDGATVDEAFRSVADSLVDKLAGVFNIPAADIDGGLPMSSYGVDSLVAVKLKNWLWSAAKSEVSIFEILQASSLEAFASLAAGRNHES
ncbi:type I polyketide synthase [Colletotrichum plurivorum]|uniref:Type I polyketide synthase n=1 Tax=Colletotrichum plurivorum TaxID=2175906 RepID=A0A8H6K4S0_9PEZI|nr:type I polyketide synthase [Colletotrichum plurivorum]